MKVTVQNGAVHGLSRRDVEAIIPLFPKSWSASVQQIVLYQGQRPGLSTAYYSKKNLLGLFWPAEVTSVTKAEGLEELLVALSVVSERGELPTSLSKSIREWHAAGIAGLLETCLEALARNAA